VNPVACDYHLATPVVCREDAQAPHGVPDCLAIAPIEAGEEVRDCTLLQQQLLVLVGEGKVPESSCSIALHPGIRTLHAHYQPWHSLGCSYQLLVLGGQG